MRQGDAVEASEGATVHLRMSRTQRRPAGVVSSSETRNKIARHVVRVESMLTRGIPNPLESRGPVGSQRCKRVLLLSRKMNAMASRYDTIKAQIEAHGAAIPDCIVRRRLWTSEAS